MLTNRARLLILVAVAGSVLGLLRGQQTLSVISLSALLWLLIEWLLFRWRVDLQLRHVQVVRRVNGSTVDTGRMWTGREFDVSVRLQATRSIRIPFARVKDVLPENVELVADRRAILLSDADAVHPANVCDLELHGLTPADFDYRCRALSAGSFTLPGVSVQVFDLHGLFTARSFIASRQTFRVFPTCLEVDTARPVTKQVNALPPPGIHRLQRAGMGSELLELREYVPGDPPKSIAWKVSARRDVLMTRQYESEVPVRTMLFVDASYGTRIGHFGQRGIDQLVFVAGSIARSAMSLRDPVGLVAFDDAGSRSVASGLGDRHFYTLMNELIRCASPASPPPASYSSALLNHTWVVCEERWPELLDTGINRVPFTWLPIMPENRYQFLRRMRLAAVLTELYGLGPAAPVRLTHDDREMADRLQRLLLDCGYAWTWPVVEHRSREVHDWHGKFETLTDALTRAVARGRDNELYVLLVDLIDHRGSHERLEKAIRVALARHHRVAVICPAIELPPDLKIGSDHDRVRESLRRAEQHRLRQLGDRLQLRLRRLGVPVAFARDRSALPQVLAEAELARNGRTLNAGSR